jgi:hypothetical protein
MSKENQTLQLPAIAVGASALFLSIARLFDSGKAN